MYKDPRSKKKSKAKKKYSPKTIVRPGMTEDELHERLVKTVFALVATIVLIIASFIFLGPKIGSLFGLISVHRNDQGRGDTIAPAAPVLSSIPKATKDKTLKFNGVAEPGSTVNVFLNGPIKASTVADQEGLFTVTGLTLIEGKNTLFAKAIDQEGNESDKTQTYNIIRDTKKPEIEILEPTNGSTIKNLNSRVTVKGEINEDASVSINNRKAIVKSDNTFELLLGVKEGNVEIKITATDTAGNETIETIYINYEPGN